MVCIETGWCTNFHRRLGRWRAPASLSSAYRAPSLFAQQMVRGGAHHHDVSCDEDFQPPASPISQSVVYICTHGQIIGGDYRMSTERTDRHKRDHGARRRHGHM